jgi:toxin-antitoxin system PIN domain toxin
MRFLVDSNVLVSAAMEESPGHADARAVLLALARKPVSWCVGWVNLYEFMRISTHRKVFRRPLAWDTAFDIVERLLHHPGLEVLQETAAHLAVCRSLAGTAGGAAGNFVHDCHVAALMQEHDVRTIVTADAHFRRFGIFEVLGTAQLKERLA